MAQDKFAGGSPPTLPAGPSETPPSLVIVLVLDLVGTVIVVVGLLMLLIPDQQLIPQSTGLPENAIGVLMVGMLLIGIAVYLLMKRIRIMGASRKTLGGNDT